MIRQPAFFIILSIIAFFLIVLRLLARNIAGDIILWQMVYLNPKYLKFIKTPGVICGFAQKVALVSLTVWILKIIQLKMGWKMIL